MSDKNMQYTLDDFDYPLPPELIAQRPLPERAGSRLLVVRGAAFDDRRFAELPDLLEPGDLLVLNDTRVLHARLRGSKASGGQVEVLIERLVGAHEALAQVRASKSPRPGSRMRLAGAIEVEVLGREGEFYRLGFPPHHDVVDLIERHGEVPLPPYIERPAEYADESRYQTVFARNRGSVAAPTAGLHFDDTLLARLRDRGVRIAFVTLHVGAGTFQPVRVSNLAQHRMHRERYRIPQATVDAVGEARARGGRVIAVGTTSLRALEGAAQGHGGALAAAEGETDIFILPGFEFRVADCLVTNFHLPKSTLLMLVSAFAGYATIRRAYFHAVAQRYRFFSYGDAMFLAGTRA
ncbi:MAG: tRNA preQ1(34) S-adenosylmethionine ribosyltransferase-isomerase QueA [Sterolibacteriaceae bacterium]|nr:tRNA preQ1(34) S-adenosylmethionine ribosyltransferase-isomerase QueA [Candidatus Methylophosphatis haderslevensis]